MDFELDPSQGVGPLQVGMTRAEANAALESLRDTSAISGSDIPGRHVFRPSGLKITIECRSDRLLALSLWRPKVPADTLSFQGIDVFAESALEVVNGLRVRILIEPAEDDPASFIAPDLLLSLWRPFEADDEPDESLGFFFSSVLPAAPGYYDTPAQAAERGRRTGGKLLTAGIVEGVGVDQQLAKEARGHHGRVFPLWRAGSTGSSGTGRWRRDIRRRVRRRRLLPVVPGAG